MRLLVILLALAACSASGPAREDGMLAIGDSILAWNGDNGIPDVAAARLGLPLRDATVSGARLIEDRPSRTAIGLDIQRQWEANAGRWAWVILDGGGNDLRPVCREDAAIPARDQLIGPDLTGVIPDLIARIRDTGSRAVFVGYYDGAEASPTGFTPCQPHFTVMNERLSRLAARDPGLIFLDAGNVIDPARTDLYDRDLTHPSPEGSRLIGEALAARIAGQ
ncbi:SGNH/GDSL hydrolase family protein [Jannaschia aquimarina]|uniref:SGNH hydrolase-type esterase domain-containing protein n=1 Tax=Jannaschia aquimarina TaxID=935700 RepID=A0A0D1EHQ9_9RHOB|nr:SGNH/GDSL hydrolase family protein [Jannaschia aquimarina]KIT15345.1 hypothetical protein jaqu_29600 [Jannaschia aquimarina]SNS51725.1 Lysophospholipase L1 [Jannaschia aquimarina]